MFSRRSTFKGKFVENRRLEIELIFLLTIGNDLRIKWLMLIKLINLNYNTTPSQQLIAALQVVK